MLLGNSASSGQIALGVRFYLNDQFSGPVKAMKNQLTGYKDEFQAFQENLRVARNIAATVAAAGLLATRGMYSASMEGAEFLFIMKGVEAITEATNVQMAELNSLSLKLGRETMFMPEDIASGMRFMAMAGQDAETIKGTMESATNLAGATMTSLGGKMGAADIMTNALKAFGWEAQRSGQMADILTAATTNANVSLVDLGNSIRYVSATSRNLQIPVPETVGLLMSLGNAGIQSSMAGTALENMYRYLARSLTGNAAKKAREAWESMGLGKSDVTTATGRFKPMVEILGMMNKSMKGMDPIQTQAIFKNIFGVRGVRGAATIARNLKEAGGFISMLSDEKQIGGTAAEKMSIMMNSLKGASDKLVSTWKGLKVAFAEAAGKWLIPLMLSLKNILGYVTDLIKTPFGGFVARAVFGLTAIVGVLATLKMGLLTVAYAMKTLTVSTGGMVSAMKIAYGFMGMGSMGYNLAAAPIAAGMVKAAAPVRATGASSPLFMPMANGRMKRAGPGYPIGPRPMTSARISTIPLMTKMTGATSALKKATPIMGRIAGVGGKILGFLSGPWGIAIMALATIVPMIYSAQKKNIDAINENTKALAPKPLPMSQEIWALIQSKKIGDLTQQLLDNMILTREQHMISQDRLEQLLEKQDLSELIQLFLTVGGIETGPVVGKRNP